MYRIGIDLGGTHMSAAIMKGDCIIFKKQCATRVSDGAGEIVRDMAELLLSILQKSKIGNQEISKIGIGSPGYIDSKNGIVIDSANLHFTKVPVASMLKNYIDRPIRLGNDADCAALAEYRFYRGKGYKTLVMITIGTGIGSGVIVNGKVYKGSGDAGSELGHMLFKSNGVLCTCGRKGCWEAYASASALIRRTKKAIARHPETAMANFPEVDGKTAFQAAKENDPVAKQLVKAYLHDVADGLVNAVNIFRPDIMVIGGGISHEGAYILQPIQKFVDKYSSGSRLLVPPRIKLAHFENDAGIIGASLL